MSIIKHVTLQKIVAHDFRYDLHIVYNFKNILSFLAKKHVGYGNVCRFIHREYPCVVWLVFMSWTTTECCVTFDICILPTQCAYDLQVSKQTAIIYDLTVVLQWIAFFVRLEPILKCALVKLYYSQRNDTIESSQISPVLPSDKNHVQLKIVVSGFHRALL